MNTFFTRLGIWVSASRPWSFTASAIPVMVGGVFAWRAGSFHLGLFCTCLLAGVLLQAAVNIMNTYTDYVCGVDTVASAVTCPQLTTGLLTPRAMYIAGHTLYLVVFLLILSLVWKTGIGLLPYVPITILGAYFYTHPRFSYKYYGVGPFLVFFLMGPLMVCPVYYVLTGSYALAPFLASLSLGCFVVCIMHANDIRDIKHDTSAGITTLAMRLGATKALWLYAALYATAFIILLCGTALGYFPLWTLAPCILLPKMVDTLQKATHFHYDISALEGWSAKYHLLFGVTFILGLILSGIL